MWQYCYNTTTYEDISITDYSTVKNLQKKVLSYHQAFMVNISPFSLPDCIGGSQSQQTQLGI